MEENREEKKLKKETAVYLPEELLIEFLARLPVKSLLRFKCVSKNWYQVIKSPSFIDNHFHHPQNHPHTLITSRVYWPDTKTTVSLLSPPNHPDIYTDNLPHTQTLFIEHGPVNGLFLVRYNNRFALWNPATRDFHFLPPLPPPPNPHKKMIGGFSLHFGFGLCPLTNVYTVVTIVNYQYEHPEVRLLVWSCTTDSWTQTQIHPVWSDKVRNIWADSSVFLDGACYWASRIRNHISLVSFHIATQELQEIQGAPILPFNASEVRLTLHNHDSIALFLYQYSDRPIHMWLMNPKEKTWIDKFSIGHVQIDKAHGFWKDDLMIVTRFYNEMSHLAVFNTNNNSIRNLGIYGRFFRVYFNYKESLYSFKR